MSERLRTLREEILGWTSLSRLVNELKLARRINNPVGFERLIKELQQQVEVRMRGRELLVISYEHQNPKLAQQLVSTISSIVIDRNTKAQTAEAGTAISFIEGEMGVYQKKLEDSEAALRQFKELYEMQMPVATELNRQIINLEVSLAALLVENTEQHPRVVETRHRIADLKAKRNEEIKRVISQAISQGQDPAVYRDFIQAIDQPVDEADVQTPAVLAAKEAYQAWVKRLDSPIATPPASPAPTVQLVTTPSSAAATAPSFELVGGSAASVTLAPRQEQELARLTRDYEISNRTYQHLQERLERAKITQRLGESDEGVKFKVLEPARVPLRPVKPNLLKMFLFGLMLGLCLGAGVAFAAEYLDQSFQSAEEVSHSLELPVLGSISPIVTPDDIAQRRQRLKARLNPKRWRDVALERCKPVAATVDRLLAKWNL